jgi:hypothetical protein
MDTIRFSGLWYAAQRLMERISHQPSKKTSLGVDIWDYRRFVQPLYPDPSHSGHMGSYRRCRCASVDRVFTVSKRIEKAGGGRLSVAIFPFR